MLKSLHDQYGPIVRTGPNDISVIDSESVKSVLGSEGLGKGPGYLNFKISHQPYPLIAMPTGDARTDRRRVWSRGFTSESIKEYQHIIVDKATQLADGLNGRINSEVDLGQWLGFFAFGGGSGTLKDGKDTDGALEVLRKGVGISQIMTQVPWLSHFVRFIPAISRNEIRLRDFSVNWCTRRIQNGAEKKDLWYHLTDEAGHEKVKPTSAVVASDSALAIVAGSDTTSTAMTNLFWCLMAHPTVYKQLQEEVDREYPAGIDPLVDTSRFGNMKFLNACLNESLRLFPPVPTNGPRVVTEGSGGRVISGHFIPEGTQVLVPPYVVHRSPENFSPSPDAFVPHRWVSDTRDARERIQRADAFIPFSYGPTNCVGKNLARLEILMVVTMLVQKFQFEFAKAFDWKEWPNKQTDVLIILSEPLKVNLKARA
ncbi:hypothetical protein AAF712_010547 [Marasmius tenuissimus]|uniref:Cytochrome P450 n=1 Tax=Marasmius tenuissimus TaxID=585030 RepID=A0ABR2ZPF0_9AGAR